MPVTAEELVADAKPARGRHGGADGRLERPLPETAGGERGAIVLGIGVLGAEDAEAREVVAHRDRNRAFDQRIPAPARDLVEPDVTGREIDLIDADEDQLQRTALGANHEIEAAGVAQ